MSISEIYSYRFISYHNAKDFFKEKNFSRFLSLYNANFPPDSDESENIENILARVKGERNEYDPFSYLFVVYDSIENEELLVGAMVLEYYTKSNCSHLTYLFVDKNLRKKGYGRFIIQKGIPICISEIEGIHQVKKIEAVFFETENPSLTPQNPDNEAILYQRIRFFEKVEAKWIDLPYVQPSFAGKSRVYNLFLMVFPKLTNLRLEINKNLVFKFLTDLYNSLEYGTNKRPLDEKLSRLDDDLLRMRLSMDISDILEDIDPLLKFDTKDKVDLWSYKSILKQQYILNAKGIESDDHNILVKIDQEVKQIFGNYTSPKIIDEKFYLREVPVFYKQPKFLFSKVSLAFHFVEHQEIMEFPTQYSLEYCPIFSSYERDLLSQRFHMNPPYHSVCYLENIEVEVEFDTEFQFTSEGRKETLFIKNSENNFDNYSKKIRAFLNKMTFKNSRIVIWELVLTNADGVRLNELEIIQFIKYYTGGQEKYISRLNFKYNDRNFELNDLLRELISQTQLDTSNKTYTIASGTAQIDTGIDENEVEGSNENIIHADGTELLIKQPEDVLAKYFDLNSLNSGNKGLIWKQIYRLTRLSHEKDNSNEHELEEVMRDIPEIKELFEVFCGFCIGIFDFDRMEYEEILDTINPRLESATNTQMLIMNRNALTCFCHNDNLFRESWDKMGISPYLIIPNSVIAHNSFLIENTEAYIDDIINLNNKNKTYKALIKDKKMIDENLNTKLLSNVFQYPTEQDLYQFGHQHRGINELIESIKEKKVELKDNINILSERRRKVFEAIIGLLLGIVSLAQIYDPLKEATGAFANVIWFSITIIFSIGYIYGIRKYYTK